MFRICGYFTKAPVSVFSASGYRSNVYISNVYIIILACIDQTGPAFMKEFALKMSVAFVDVSVEHVLRPDYIEKCVETGKSSVGNVLQIPPASGGSMGDENVHTSVQDRLQPRLEGPLPHLSFCIHTGAFFIAK